MDSDKLPRDELEGRLWCFDLSVKASYACIPLSSNRWIWQFLPCCPTPYIQYKVNWRLPAYTNTRAGAETDRKQQSRARWNRGAVRLKPVASQKLSHAELDPKLLSGPGVFLFISSSSSLAKRGRAMSGQAEFVAWTATALLGLAVQTLEQTYAMKKHE